MMARELLCGGASLLAGEVCSSCPRSFELQAVGNSFVDQDLS